MGTDPTAALKEPLENPNIERVFMMIKGSWISQVIYALARFAIADELAKGPATAAELAARRGMNPDAAFRLMRAAASLGLATADAGLRFAATPMLETLRQDVPGSLHGAALVQGGPGWWLPWGNFADAIRTGERQTLPVHGKEMWDYFAGVPEEAAAFTRTMSGMTEVIVPHIVRQIDAASVEVAADIGGAAGALLLALMAANPKLRGILFDLPNIVPLGVAAAERSGLQDRFSALGGDFFAAVPGADLYLLKWILHDWDDAACIRILSNCAKAMRPGGRVIVIEFAIGEMNEPGYAPLLDLHMLTVLTGRERSVPEHRALLRAAGLSLVKVTPVQAAWTVTVMEAVAE